MDKKSKALLIIFILGIVAAVGATYYRFYVARDYVIFAEIECDPEINSCFVWEDEEGIWYYNLIEKDAKNVPLCNPHREECDELSCEEDEENCEEFFCEAEELEDGEECAGPGMVFEDEEE